jgi:Xaa-Pro dipeptidase
MALDVAAVQRALAEAGLDGWLLYDFRGSNPIARSVIGFDPKQIATRRWFYFIPASGEPVAIQHAIEPAALRGAPGRSVVYRSWRELEALLKQTLSGRKRVAMEYSPRAAIPYVGRVDAGTIEMVREAGGVEVVTSADLVQMFEAAGRRSRRSFTTARPATCRWPRTRPSPWSRSAWPAGHR